MAPLVTTGGRRTGRRKAANDVSGCNSHSRCCKHRTCSGGGCWADLIILDAVTRRRIVLVLCMHRRQQGERRMWLHSSFTSVRSGWGNRRVGPAACMEAGRFIDVLT